MSKNKTMWAVTDREDGEPRFHRFTNGPCATCGLQQCLPDQPHGPGRFYHIGTGRFLSWLEVEALNEINGQGSDLSTMPTDSKTLAEYETGIKARQEERRRKTRERNRRYYQKKRQRQVLNHEKSDL